MIALLTALIQQIQDLEDAAFRQSAGTMLYDGTTYPAVGTQLDGIGQIVGISRNGTTDPQYLLLILGKIAENFSDGTIPTLIVIASLVFNTEDVTLTELFPAEIAVEVGDPGLGSDLYFLATQMVSGGLGAGIELAFTAFYPSGDGFEFTTTDDPSSTGGYDDLLSPGAGGVLATLIYPITP